MTAAPTSRVPARSARGPAAGRSPASEPRGDLAPSPSKETQVTEVATRAATLLGSGRFRTVLARRLVGQGAPPVELEREPVPLKAHRNRATFRLDWVHGEARGHLVAKWHARVRGDLLTARRRIVKAGFGPTSSFGVPEALFYLPRHHVLIEEFVEGTPASSVFRSGPADGRLEAARRSGAWLAQFHTRGPARGPRIDPPNDPTTIWARDLESRAPAPIAAKTTELRRSLLLRRAARADRNRNVAVHGSFLPEHVLLAGPRTVVLDLDEHGAGDPARDLAWYVVALRRLALKSGAPAGRHERPASAFLEEYRARRGGLPGGLDVELGLECLHRAWRDVAKYSPPDFGRAYAMLDEGLRFLDERRA